MVFQCRQNFLGEAMNRTGVALQRNTRRSVISLGVILIGILVFSRPLVARESTDVIVMKNGDRLTGTIKRLEAGVLYVGLGYVDGDLSIDWKKVARLESHQLFIIKTQDGSVYMGQLVTVAQPPGSQPTQLQIVEAAEAEKPLIVDPARVVNVRQTSEDFLKRWSGDISFGSAYSKGNNTTQYNLGFGASYRRERWTAETSFNSNLAANTGATTSTRNALTENVYHLLPWDNYFYGGLGSFLQSSVQGISSQTSLGTGIGRFLKNTNRTRLALLGGLAWQRTNYQQSGTTQTSQDVVAGLVALNLSLFQFSRTNLQITANAFPALTESGRVRLNTNVSYYVKVFGKLDWNLTFYGNWDTKPPPHFSGSDYGTTSGLSLSFGK